MSCPLNDSQIQSWLDGDSDQSLHLADCPECQQRMLSMQKLRSRLVPPPSPLGRDFARRTAQHVLRVSDVIKPNKPATGWWGRLRDNPLLHVVQRERARRMLRVPGLAAILLLYLLPGGFVFQSGDSDANWAYFGMVRIGLTLLVPLFLLSLEWTSLSSLVRGRCLEEMLQTGLEPVLVSDTLALSGLRSLVPALVMIGLALLPVHPQSLLVWLPMTALAFSAAGYLSQAHLLGLRWPRWLSFLGAAAVAGSLGAPAPWNLVSATVLAGLGYAARRQSIYSLELQQQGRLPARRRNRGAAWQTWLARRLPDLALLQRELRRRNLITPSILVSNLGVCLATYTAFSKNAYCWPLMAGVAGLLAAFSLVQREKDGGAYEVLLHSGVRPRDFWASAVWIAGLQFLPACVAGVIFTFARASSVSWMSAGAAALGTLLALFISLRAGAVIGASIAVASHNSRQASTRCIQEAALLCLLSLLMLGLVAPLVGEGSPLARFLETLGLSLTDAMDGMAILPVMLALHLRARSLAGPSFEFNPWTYSLATVVPVCVWLQMVNFYPTGNSQANSCTGVALLIGLLWAWWAAPLASKPDWRRWTLLSLSFAGALLLGIPVSMWSLAILSNFRSQALPVGLSQLDNLQLTAVIATAAWLVYLLGRRFAWEGRPNLDLRRRSLWAGGLCLAVAGCFTHGMLSLARTPRPHAGEFEAFLAKQKTPREPKGTHPMGQLLKKAGIYDSWGSYPQAYSIVDRPELDRLEPYQPEFEQLLSRLLVEPGRQQDFQDALWVLYLQAGRALYLSQRERFLELLEKMTVLAGRCEDRQPGSTRVISFRMRAQIFLAARSQGWTSGQLDRLDGLQASIPDGPQRLRTERDQSAALHYLILRSNRWEYFQDFQSSAINRFFLRHQAEIFLDGYLAGRQGQSGNSLAESHLYQVTFWQDERAAGRQILAECDRVAIELERWKLKHGHYPAGWTDARKGIRLAYQSLGASYYLKVWIARTEGPPAILVSQGPEFRLSSPYY